MFSLPGRLASPALQRSGAFLHFVNDKCTELCDIIQSNVTRVYQELSSPVKQKKATGVKSKSTFKRKLSNVLKYFRYFAFAMYLPLQLGLPEH